MQKANISKVTVHVHLFIYCQSKISLSRNAIPVQNRNQLSPT